MSFTFTKEIDDVTYEALRSVYPDSPILDEEGKQIGTIDGPTLALHHMIDAHANPIIEQRAAQKQAETLLAIKEAVSKLSEEDAAKVSDILGISVKP